MALILSILFSISAAWFVVIPLSRGELLSCDEALLSQDSLSDQRDRFVQMLRDLELDYATAKVSLSDYEQTKYDLSIQLSEILNKLEVRDNA